ncbi:hypothetical protein B0H19DRAFT_1102860 [Mycena capillaripes]|nr:hypothetical protein B0H19DRAFT_1102860 [Mycena capillaripes]
MQGICSDHVSAQPPARKRPRPSPFDLHDADFTLTEDLDAAALFGTICDSEYYKEGGDCRILVEDTLFCIHRFLLERDSPIFQTMFQLPQGGEKPQGSTEEDPIVIVGDTVEQFRALCWALYVLPDEIAFETLNAHSMEKLIDVATISHKYQLAAFESWSFSSIRRRCDKITFGRQQTYLLYCPSNLLPAFLRLSKLYDDDDLTKRVVAAWLFRLATPTASSPLPVSEFSAAFLSAEENQHRRFLGQLYLARLEVANRESNKLLFPSIDFPFEELEARHLQCIMQGSWSLSTHWQRLISSIPILPKDRCQHHTSKCIPMWINLWRQASTVHSTTDILRRLKFIEGILEIADFECAKKGKVVVKALYDQVDHALPDYFLGPP